MKYGGIILARERLNKEERTLGWIITSVIVLVFAVGLFFEYNWWRGASIVTAVAGMAIILTSFRFYAKRIRAEEPKAHSMEVESDAE
jgi:Flp pilus assembly protein TadB